MSIGVSLAASFLLDGRQKQWSLWTVQGQKEEFARKGLPEKRDGWYVIPGKIDRSSWFLLVYFALCVVALAVLYDLI